MSEPSNTVIQAATKKPRASKKPVVKLDNPMIPSVAAVAAVTAVTAVAGVTEEPAVNQVIHPKGKNVKKEKVEKKEKKEKEERETCSICAEYYTPCIRRKVVCKYCNHDTCSKCVEHYLLSKHEDAHCLHCHVNYSNDVLREICTKTYLQQTYFQHRQAVLINRSRAQLPGLQDEALRMRKRRERAEAIASIRLDIAKIKKEKDVMIKEYSNIHAEMYKLRISAANDEEEREQIRKQKVELRNQLDDIESKIGIKTDLIRGLQGNIYEIVNQGRERTNEDEVAAAAEEEEKRRFIRRCTRDSCQGFLSQAWKCGMCEWYSCSKCFAVKGAAHDTPHECTAEALETAALIRKNCKPCPKCGEQIEHGGGCSQMWCISCKTPWDWNTGKIVTSGPIHNPLFYEWQRRTGGAVPRNPADIPCGGYPHHWELVRLPRGMKNDIADKYYEFFRICQELQAIARNNYRSHMDEQNTNQIHVRFLLHDFDEKQWGRHLACQEKLKKRDAEIQEVFAAFHMVAIELINRVQNYNDNRNRTFTHLTVKEAEDFIEALDIEIQELIRMINDALRKISICYCYRVVFIHCYLHHGRYTYGIVGKNFSHDMKKTRPAKNATAVVDTQEVQEEQVEVAEAADAADAAEATPIDDSEVEEMEEEPPRTLHYDSDSDNSVASDIQAAIEASLQD